MTQRIDLRSDTVTQPTETMRDAMFNAEVGDDVLQEDPTINRLEAYAAKLLGKQAALFVPSGTFGNQCALMSHTKSGDEVIVSELAHIIQHEAGAAGVLSRVQTRVVMPSNGRYMRVDDIHPRIRWGEDIHYPDTGLITYEQATAMGDLVPIDEMARIRELADDAGVPVHIDGARFFNAAAALDVEPSELARYADSITFCLSKGLSAPVGSLLVGTKAFIARARQNRKIMGGGMRQAGFLAAAGLVALDTMRDQLGEDHANARLLAEALAKLAGVTVPRMPDINLLFVAIEHPGMDALTFVDALEAQDVLTYPPEDGLYRFVTHFGVTREDVMHAAEVIADVLQG